MIEKILNMDRTLTKYKIALNGIIKICNAVMNHIEKLERQTNEKSKSNDRHITNAQDIPCEVCD